MLKAVYAYQSYHSIRLPIEPRMTLPTTRRSPLGAITAMGPPRHVGPTTVGARAARRQQGQRSPNTGLGKWSLVLLVRQRQPVADLVVDVLQPAQRDPVGHGVVAQHLGGLEPVDGAGVAVGQVDDPQAQVDPGPGGGLDHGELAPSGAQRDERLAGLDLDLPLLGDA